MLCSTIAPNIYHDQCIFVTFRSPSSPYITHNPYVYKMHLQFLVSAELSMWLLKTFHTKTPVIPRKTSRKVIKHFYPEVERDNLWSNTSFSNRRWRQLVSMCLHILAWPEQCGVQCKHDHQQFPASGSWWLMGTPGTVEQGGGVIIMLWHKVVTTWL